MLNASVGTGIACITAILNSISSSMAPFKTPILRLVMIIIWYNIIQEFMKAMIHALKVFVIKPIKFLLKIRVNDESCRVSKFCEAYWLGFRGI